jgi:hypothetical protein
MENFLAALGDFASIKHTERAAFGYTSVKRDINVQVSDGHTTSKRRYLSSEEYTALGQIEVSIEMPLDDPRGLNVDVVSDQGVCTDELFLAVMRRYHSVSRPTLIDMSAEVERYRWADSHISLLVALLSLYYTRKAHETGAVTDISDYNDGHIKISGKDLIVPAPVSDDWRPDEIVENIEFDPVTLQEPPSHQCVSLAFMREKEKSVLLTLINGKKKTSQFAFDLEIPKLADKICVVGSSPVFEMAPANVHSSVVMATLNKYVTRHRLEASFQAAMHIMLQCALQPVPDTAEGLAWLRRRRILRLPQYSSWRAAYKPLLLDRPFGYDAQVAQTWKWWNQMKLSAVPIGGAFNALSLWGRYFVEAGYYDEAADVGRLGHHYFRENPGAAYYSYAALITGHETMVDVPAMYGLEYGPWDGEEDFKFGVEVLDLQDAGYNLEVSEDKTELVVKELPPPCSAIHILGKMPNEGMYSCLSSSYKVQFQRVSGGWLFPSVNQAWGFGMATRWLGYDVEMTYNGVRRRGNWASNPTGVAARPFAVKGPDLLGVVVNSVAPREKVFRSLPSMGKDYCEWTINVEVSNTATVLSLAGGRVRAEGKVSMGPVTNQPEIYVPSNTETAYSRVRMVARSRARPLEAGFQVLEQTSLIVPSERVEPSGPSIPLDDGGPPEEQDLDQE